MSGCHSRLFVAATHGHQMDLLEPKFDLVLVPSVQVKHCSASRKHRRIALLFPRHGRSFVGIWHQYVSRPRPSAFNDLKSALRLGISGFQDTRQDKSQDTRPVLATVFSRSQGS